MAVSIFTLTIYEGGINKIYNINLGSPSTNNLKGVQYSTANNKLIIKLTDFEIEVPFTSTNIRTAFITALFNGFDSGSSFALDNLGPIATTTTTTTVP